VRRGTLFVLAGPSGVGKGSVVQRLHAKDDLHDIALSVSATTRPPRAGERDGVDYRFVDDATFDAMIADGALLEWAGHDVILEIDVQGAAQVRNQAPDAVLILLEPPSLEVLEERLRGRGTEDDRSIAERLAAAQRELEQAGWFDHVVVNDDVDRAADRVAAIIEASRTR
jgi:guanylate kinase